MKTSPPPPVLDLGHHPQPELGALGLLDPQAQNLFVALNGEAQRQIDRLVADHPLVADFDPERVENDDRINLVQGPVLPVPNLVHDFIGDPRNQIRRHADAIQLLQVTPDFAHRHAARVHRYDLVIETLEAPLALLDDLRGEAGVAVAGHRDRHLAILAGQLLRAVPVARAPSLATREMRTQRPNIAKLFA